MMAALIASLAVAADALLGEPRRAHPLVAFGRLAQHVEARLCPGAAAPASRARLRGALALLVAVLPATLVCACAIEQSHRLPALAIVLQVVVLYLAIGHRSLREHAQAVLSALRMNEPIEARRRVGFMVSRETGAMDSRCVAAATVESVLENGSDAILAALFWFAVAGAPGALAYRLVNTLDAMWGYRTPRYRHFGWAAARLDDLLNWVPARLTALSYALVSGRMAALRCWSAQARAWDSPNGGPVMAAGAGALHLRLGGAAIYHGAVKLRPVLGEGREPQAEDILRSLNLVLRALLLWLTALWLGAVLLAQVQDA